MPQTVLVPKHTSAVKLDHLLFTHQFSFPLIAKPDRGERGNGVKKLTSRDEVIAFLEDLNVDYLLQPFITSPIECSVLHYCYPNASTGAISSVTLKEFLTITGNGKTSIQQLIEQHPRAYLQLARLQEENKVNLTRVPRSGEQVALGEIGNHCLGTKFLNGNHLINDKMVKTFDHIQGQLSNINYARYDLKCNSIDDLYTGQNIHILEINGVGAEPAHIYDPNFNYSTALSVLKRHYKTIFDIAIINKNNNLGRFYTTREGIRWWKAVKSSNQALAKCLKHS